MGVQEITKIERVTEAVESLVTAAVELHAAAPGKRGRAFNNVSDAREEFSTALSELLKPTLRVVGA